MTRLTSSQQELVAALKRIAVERTETEGRGCYRHLGNTHQIAKRLGHRQSYESYLRDRLFRLVNRGVLRFKEIGADKVTGWCRERIWFFA
jgi:IS1 family transposase